MGHFLAVSAFRTESVEDVITSICDYLKTHKAPAQRRMLPVNSDDYTDAVIYEPRDGWCVVLWPSYFCSHDFPLVRSVSDAMATAASTIHVYDSDYWEHLFRYESRDVHLFCSRPYYWKEDNIDLTEQILAYNSDPAEFCAILGMAKSTVKPYLVDADKQELSSKKAFEDDEYSIDNFWVFVDFWRRLGISYPNPPDKNNAAVLRLPSDFTNILPAEKD